MSGLFILRLKKLKICNVKKKKKKILNTQNLQKKPKIIRIGFMVKSPT